jgi:hypothetical protein
MRVRLLAPLLASLAFPATTPAADRKPRKGAFGLDKVWSLHLTIGPKDWERMQPTNRGGPFGPGGFGPPRPPEKGKEKPAEKSTDRSRRGLFGFDFEYVKARLEVGGKTYKDVGVRFKGSGTYIVSQGRLKRPFKIDLGRYAEGQSFLGLKKLTLNNNAMDPTAAREVLAYPVFRALGVPAPRTAYARLTLTVPGKYDREFLGLYVLAETPRPSLLPGEELLDQLRQVLLLREVVGGERQGGLLLSLPDDRGGHARLEVGDRLAQGAGQRDGGLGGQHGGEDRGPALLGRGAPRPDGAQAGDLLVQQPLADLGEVIPAGAREAKLQLDVHRCVPPASSTKRNHRPPEGVGEGPPPARRASYRRPRGSSTKTSPHPPRRGPQAAVPALSSPRAGFFNFFLASGRASVVYSPPIHPRTQDGSRRLA